MKKCLCAVFTAALLLGGCAAEPVFEAVSDVYEPQAVVMGEIFLVLPEDAAALTMDSGDTGTLYFCDGYTLTVQTMQAGDLSRSLETLTGYGADALTVLETRAGGLRRYECAWTSAGEGGDQVGRLLLLDDGTYHYAVTVMADAASAGDLAGAWDELFDSVSVSHTGT